MFLKHFSVQYDLALFKLHDPLIFAFLSSFFYGQSERNAEGWVLMGLCISCGIFLSTSLCAVVVKKVVRKERENQVDGIADPFILCGVVRLQ